MTAFVRESLLRLQAAFVEGAGDPTNTAYGDRVKRSEINASRQTGWRSYHLIRRGEVTTMPKQTLVSVLISAKVRTTEDDGFTYLRDVTINATEADLSESAKETLLERALFEQREVEIGV